MHRLGIVALSVLLLLQAVIIAFSPRVSVAADSQTIVVCTGSGMKVMSLSVLGLGSPDDLDPDDTRHLTAGDHCALCAFGHSALPPLLAAILIVPDLGTQSPQGPAQPGHYDGWIYYPNQARAPPPSNV
ncbi:hypothetical protein PuT2_13360 [Pusillimonas sp. T2]|nr:hypothetical protein PuT2_13360 [Pusillimonas sp. T2]